MAETYSNLQQIYSFQGIVYDYTLSASFSNQISTQHLIGINYNKPEFNIISSKQSIVQGYGLSASFSNQISNYDNRIKKYYAPDLAPPLDLRFINHNITVDIDNKTITSYVALNNGMEDTKTYYFTNEYNQIQYLVDADLDYDVNGLVIEFIANLTNGKLLTKNWQLSKLDAEKLYAAIQSFYSDFKGLWIKIGDLEYLFPIISREKQPDLNITKNVAINGSLEYEVLGNPLNKWTFEVYVDDYSKIVALEQLLQNPVCYVKFDEIGDYRQCLITNISYSRITSGKYNASIELTIL